MAMGGQIRVEGVTKRFTRVDGTVVNAVVDVTLTIEAGELLVLLGPSGCGKTTLLRSIAGLERPSEGRISGPTGLLFDAVRKVDVPIEDRRIGMVFQSYALWPHKSVLSNVTYPLRARGLGRSEARRDALVLLEKMGIRDVSEQYPHSISGGQQQRAALARAIVSTQDVVLFDEPLSNVDAFVRAKLRAEILAMQREFGFTGVYVTHDQEEAMALATRIAVMKNGRIEQIGAPRDIYHRPESLYIARFVGTTNEMEVTISSRKGKELIAQHNRLGQILCQDVEDPKRDCGSSAVVMSRPEMWRISECTLPGTLNSWRGTIVEAVFLGSRTEYVVSVNGCRVRVHELSHKWRSIGQDVQVSIDPTGLLPLPPHS